jgi:hypothetical protein
MRTAQNYMNAASVTNLRPQLKVLPARALYELKKADQVAKWAATKIAAGTVPTLDQIMQRVSDAKGKPAKAAKQKAAPAPKTATAPKAAPEAKPDIPASTMKAAGDYLSKHGVEKAKLLIAALEIEIAKIAGA